MNLTQIKDEVCRECGAIVEYEERVRQHTNGYWNETRKFSCGAVIRWSPNFMSEYNSTACPNNAIERNKRTDREKAKKQLMNCITQLQVDEDYRDRLLNSVRHIWKELLK